MYKFGRLAILGFMVLGLVAVPAALADSVTYDLTAQNGALTGAGPYEQVTINLTSSTTATVTFTSLDTNGYTFLMASNGAADINVNAGSWTITGISATNSLAGFTAGSFSDDGSKNISGFGVFNQTLKGTGGFTTSATQISFTLTDTSGTWLSAAKVTTPNSDGQILASHAFECKDPCTTSESAANTGYVSGAVLVPEPSSSSLLGSELVLGLACVLGLRRRFTSSV